MAKDNAEKPKKDNGAGKEKLWRKIASMWKSKNFDGHNISTDDYEGTLIWQDKKTERFYKVVRCSLFTPKDGAPQDLVYNLLINLNNEYDVEAMSDEGSDDS